MGLIAFDSNVFIDFLDGESVLHGPSTAALNLSAGDSGMFSCLVFAEVLTSLVGHNLTIAQKALAEISTVMERAVFDAPIAILAAELRTKWGKKLLMPDAIHLATAIHKKADLFITNDKELMAVAQNYIPTRPPNALDYLGKMSDQFPGDSTTAIRKMRDEDR